MISYSKAQIIDSIKRYVEGTCLSTDEKPVDNIGNGSVLLEMDTSKVYLFDEENSIWKEF